MKCEWCGRDDDGINNVTVNEREWRVCDKCKRNGPKLFVKIGLANRETLTRYAMDCGFDSLDNMFYELGVTMNDFTEQPIHIDMSLPNGVFVVAPRNAQPMPVVVFAFIMGSAWFNDCVALKHYVHFEHFC